MPLKTCPPVCLVLLPLITTSGNWSKFAAYRSSVASSVQDTAAPQRCSVARCCLCGRSYKPDIWAAGSVASAVTLAAAVLEALRMMLSRLERPDGTIAATLSGDIHVIARVIAATAIAAPAAAVLAYLFVSLAGATSRHSLAGATAAVWLAAAAVSAQVTLGAAVLGALLLSPLQRWYTTLVLAALGAGLVVGLQRHQAQMLRESMRQGDKVDLEAGTALVCFPPSTHTSVFPMLVYPRLASSKALTRACFPSPGYFTLMQASHCAE